MKLDTTNLQYPVTVQVIANDASESFNVVCESLVHLTRVFNKCNWLYTYTLIVGNDSYAPVYNEQSNMAYFKKIETISFDQFIQQAVKK